MVVFAIETDCLGIVQDFMKDTHKRLQNNSLRRNPYDGGTARLPNNRFIDTPDRYLIDMTPLYPPTYLGGIFAIVGSIFWRGFVWNWLLTVGVLLLASGLLWSRYFMFVMLRLGLKKAGYNGPVRLIRDNDILKHIIDGII